MSHTQESERESDNKSALEIIEAIHKSMKDARMAQLKCSREEEHEKVYILEARREMFPFMLLSHFNK
jgi:hypothetical protein